MQVKVECIVRAIQRKSSSVRYELTVILKNIEAKQDVFGKNFNNIELTPSKALEMGDYQLICMERGLQELMQTSKGLRLRDVPAEIGIGTYADTGDKYYFVRVELCEGVKRTCYLTESQIKYLKYVNLGYEFKEEITETLNSSDVVVE